MCVANPSARENLVYIEEMKICKRYFSVNIRLVDFSSTHIYGERERVRNDEFRIS